MNGEVLFIGERRSELAKKMGVRWEDRALASKQLHDALEAAGFKHPALFVNIATPGAFTFIKNHTGPRVGMGRKVQLWLAKRGLVHIPLTHPAARGSIRRKENYAAHVRSTLENAGIVI